MAIARAPRGVVEGLRKASSTYRLARRRGNDSAEELRHVDVVEGRFEYSIASAMFKIAMSLAAEGVVLYVNGGPPLRFAMKGAALVKRSEIGRTDSRLFPKRSGVESNRTPR